MSGLLNFNDSLAAARSGDQLCSLLSPSPASSSSGSLAATPRGVSFAAIGRQMSGRFSSPGIDEMAGAPGESFPRPGGPKDLSVFLLTPQSLPELCLGAVNGGVKFCTLAREKCSVSAHSKKVQVDPNHLHSREEWLQIFQTLLDSQVLPSQPSSIATPKKKCHRYLSGDDDIPLHEDGLLASFSSWDLDAIGGDDMRRLLTHIQSLNVNLKQFQLLVGDNMDTVFQRVQELKADIGFKPLDQDPSFLSDECTTIWEMFTMMKSMLIDPSQFQQLHSTISALFTKDSYISTRLTALEQGTADLHEFTTILNSELDNHSKLLQVTSPSTTGPPLTDLRQELSSLHDRLAPLEQLGMDGASLRTLTSQLKLLEARVPSDPFVIGGRTFNSKADVALLVETEMDGLSFSLFHDVITIIESITDGQIKKSEVMAGLYQAQRVGFDEDEATYIHSFKLIVPSLLGALRKGDKHDIRYPLGAVRDFTTWNPQDNEGGVKKRIQDGMDDVSLSVTESIAIACTNHPAAAKLATDMLYQTQVFVNELCSWFDSFYMELIKTSQVPAGEAWHLVASCLRIFFEVLRKHRAPADCANSKLASTSRTTAYLWAMIQVHRELKLIRTHNFRGHPAMSPVITLHVFKTRVTITAFDKLADTLKALDKKKADTQKNFDKLHDRLSKLEKKN
jgi:hypothetical protein